MRAATGRGCRRAVRCRASRRHFQKNAWDASRGAVGGTRRARRGWYRAAESGARATRGARGRASVSNAIGEGASGRWVSPRTEILEEALLLGVFDVLERGFGAPRGRAAAPGRHGFGRTRFWAEHRGRTRKAGARGASAEPRRRRCAAELSLTGVQTEAGPAVWTDVNVRILGRRKRPDARVAPKTRGAERAPRLGNSASGTRARAGRRALPGRGDDPGNEPRTPSDHDHPTFSPAMSVLIHNVDDASFPNLAMSGNLPELLSSSGTQPLRCAAVTAGHVAVAVSNGTYLHVLSARSRGESDPRRPFGRARHVSREAELTRAAFGASPIRLDDRDEGDTHLSFHGASPVAALEFVPANSSADPTTSRALHLLAVQEDGAVAAWRWSPDERAPAGWIPVVRPAYAGGPPIVLPPLRLPRDVGHVITAKFAVEKDRKDRTRARVVRVVCLTAGAPRVSPPAVVIRDVPDASRRRDDAARTKTSESYSNGGDEIAATYPGAKTILAAGGDAFWVLVDRRGEKGAKGATGATGAKGAGPGSGSGAGPGSGAATGAGQCVAYRWSAAERRAVARVDFGVAAVAADAAAERADRLANGTTKPSSFSASSARATGLGRVAATMHHPSNELVVLTDRGNVLAIGPPLDGFPTEANDADAEAELRRRGVDEDRSLPTAAPPTARHVARLAGFADDFGPSRWWHLGHVVARGPFVWVVWHHRRRAGASAIAADLLGSPNRDGDDEGGFFARAGFEQTPPAKTTASLYHVSTGAFVGSAPLPSLPSPRRGDATNAGKGSAGMVRVVDGGSAGTFLVAGEESKSSALFELVARVPAALAAAAAPLVEKTPADVDPSATRDRARTLRAALRDCAAWGGSLERLEGALALTLAEIEASAAAAGTTLDDETHEEEREEEHEKHSVAVPCCARAGLLLRDKPGKGARGEATWRLAAEKIAEEIAAVYPAASSAIGDALGGVRTEDASFAFDAYSRATAIRAADVARAVTSRGAGENIAAEDAGEIRTRDDGEWTRDSSSRVCVGGRRGAAAGVTAVDTFLFDAMDVLERVASESSTDGDDPSRRAAKRLLRRLARAAREGARATTTEDETPRKNTNRRGDSDLEEDDALGALDDLARENAGRSRRAEYANDPTSAAMDALARAAAFAEKERVAEDRDAAPHAGRWTPFDATCACLHSAWPRALPVFVAAAARLRPEEDEDAAGRSRRGESAPHESAPHRRALARRALCAIVPDAETDDDASLAARAALLAAAGRQHAAAWTLLSRRRGGGGAERGAAGDSAPRSAPSSPAVPSSPARTTRRGWRLAARLLRAECAGEDAEGFRGAVRVFDALAAAFRHVARRGASRDGEVTGSKPNARGNEEDDDEMNPSDAARHVLAAAEALASAASRPRRGEKKKTFESIPGDALGGDAAADAMGALETLAIAAGERLARVARAMEGEGDV